MARLSIGEWVCPTAAVGPESPHAGLLIPAAPVAHYQDEDLPVAHCVPYRQLDGYSRDLQPTKHRTLVLESDRLRATFLPDLGGRLWSLVHKPSGRELLYVNPVIQPANFGIRNAWFSGGVEWNVGIFGHSVFTCAPVFCGRTVAPDGSEGLRVWEYERVRGVAWQVDFWAPEGSDFLYWMPRIVNPHDATIPMYYWTCIAVEEEPGGRVLAPTQRAIEPARAMGEDVALRDLRAEPDITYPQRRDLPRDTYFDIPEGERPWIAHASSGGEGVVHVSSGFLPGRKQWVWGMERCGRRWQEWLSPGGPPYIEIQGGLAKKQSDYVPMPAGSDWSWLEAYGPADIGNADEWTAAVEAVSARVASALPASAFEANEAAVRATLVQPVANTLHSGTGWGALEEMRRARAGERSLLPEGPRFPESSLGEAQAPWVGLVDGVPLPVRDPAMPPGDSVVGPSWAARLKGASTWVALYHEGVAHFFAGDRVGARESWSRSLALRPTGWVLRNLALLDEMEGDARGACSKILQAVEFLPGEAHLVDEACRILGDAGEFGDLERMLDRLPVEARTRPRVRLARARISLAAGRLAEVRAYFEAPCDLVDIREAETTLTDLWAALEDPAPIPWELDFRMTRG